MRKKGYKYGNSFLAMKSPQKSPKCLAIPNIINGEKWEIHNHDKDINDPSCPHLHAKNKPWKLNIYTGEIIDIISKKCIGKISKKEFDCMWNTKGFMKIVLAERAWYETLHVSNPIRWPSLPALPIADDNQNNRNNLRKRENMLKVSNEKSHIWNIKRIIRNMYKR